MCFLSFAWVDFFFQWGRARHIHLHIHSQSNKMTKPSSNLSYQFNLPSTRKIHKKSVLEVAFKVQVNLVPRFSLLFLSCRRVVGWRDPLVGPDHVATRILGGKNICWKGEVAEFLQCQGDKSTVSGWEDCCHFPTGVFALMEPSVKYLY